MHKYTPTLVGAIFGAIGSIYSCEQQKVDSKQLKDIVTDVNYFPSNTNKPILSLQNKISYPTNLILSFKNPISSPYSPEQKQAMFLQNPPEVIPLVVTTDEEQNILSTLEDILKNYIQDHSSEIELTGIHKKIIIYKQQHLLEIYANDYKLKSYSISLGDFIGNKEREGDQKTPEGTYYVSQKNPNSKFYKALLVSYPSPEDAQRGESNGLISIVEKEKIQRAQHDCQIPSQTTTLGGFIEIHGGVDERSEQDWTYGCAALKNADITEIYDYAQEGCSRDKKNTLIIIKP